jgi:hypothetical protein
MGKHEVDPATGMQIGTRGLLVQVQNGKREVVWPEEFSSAEPKISVPGWDKRWAMCIEDGDNITKEPAYKRVSRGIAYVPQGRIVVPDMPLHDNL